MSTHRRPHDVSRRDLLKAGIGITGAAALGTAGLLGATTLGARSASASTAKANPAALPVTDRFYLSKPSYELFRDTLLHQTHHAMQSFAFDNVNRRLFIVQQCNGDLDDLCINQVAFDGTLEGQMRLADAGHGVSIGVEPGVGTSYIWMECDKKGSGDSARGTALIRFPFVDGGTPSGTKHLTGSDTITCATDPIYRRLIVRRIEGGSFYYTVYDLAAASRNSFTPLAHLLQPAPWTPLPPLATGPVFQGYTAMGSWLYILDGTGGHPEAFDSYVSAVSLNTGEVRSRFLTKAGQSINFREPEGLAIYQPIDKGPRLFMGFAGHETNGGPDRYANLYYKDVLGPN